MASRRRNNAMPRALTRPNSEELLRWIEARLVDGGARLGSGVQAQALLYQEGGVSLVIKAPSGVGPRRWLSRWMLRHEARVYARIHGLPGAPRCLGLLDGRYLVLEYIDGELARYATIADRERFFDELRAHLEALHARGIAHSDLQKKDNLLVTRDGRPCLLDYGVAAIHKRGFAPFNHFHFRFAARLDLNQWVKLKYRGRPEEASAADSRLYRRTWMERQARALKAVSRRLRRLFSVSAK
jgi:predicted Ser/Thr protein kinase